MIPQPAAAPKFHWMSFLQALLSLLGLGAGLLGAAALLFLGLFSSSGATMGLQANTRALTAWAWTAVFLALPTLPSIYFAVMRLLGRPAAAGSHRGLARASLALLIFPLALAVGHWTGKDDLLSRLVFPAAAVLAAVLPIWWAVELARSHIRAGSPQRQWGVLNFALYFSTPLIFILEIIGFLLLAVLLGLWAAADPDRLAGLQRFQRELLQSGGDLEAIRELYLPLLRQPWVVFGIYAGVAVVVPLLEELFKPLALWFLVGSNLSPAAGLALGAIAGAGFALPETLLNLAGSGANPQWLGLAVGRVGTSLLHVGTTALTGAAIAAAWRTRKFHYLALALAASTAMHGLWNGLTITTGLAPLLLPETVAPVLTIACTAGLVSLAAVFIALLALLNRRLNPRTAPVVHPGVDLTQV